MHCVSTNTTKPAKPAKAELAKAGSEAAPRPQTAPEGPPAPENSLAGRAGAALGIAARAERVVPPEVHELAARAAVILTRGAASKGQTPSG